VSATPALWTRPIPYRRHFRTALLALTACLLVAGPARAQFADLSGPPVNDAGAGFGCAWIDYDQDGDLDLYLTNGSIPNHLFRNDGSWHFVDVTPAALLGVGGEYGSYWVDYDEDGDLDVFMVNGTVPSVLVRNDGGTFVKVDAGEAADTGPAQTAGWADYDLDGDLDIYVTAWNGPNRLLRNDGGTFVNATPVGMDDPGMTTGCSWADYDNDGDPDLYVANRIAGQLWRNDGNGAFTDVTAGPLSKAGVTGTAWGDYDNDGDLDLYLARELVSNRLLRNDSSGGTTIFIDFYNTVVRDERVSQGAVWFDYNNDGDLDLFVANAGTDNSSGARNTLIRNNGGGSFSDVTTGAVAQVANSRGVSAGDFDGDGYLDLYVVNWFDTNQLLRNGLPSVGNHWLHIDLVGTDSNNSAIGARVRIVAGGKAQIREVQGGNGIYSQDSPTVEFGLGLSTTTVDSLQVFWPSGNVTDSLVVAADQTIQIFETLVQTGIGDQPGPPKALLYANMPNPFRSTTAIRYDLLERSPVLIRITDVNGRLVRTLENLPSREAGTYEARWNGLDDLGRRLPQGVYFYNLLARDFRQSRSMVLLR